MGIKIIDVTVHVIKSDLDIPFAFSQGWVKKRSATIVEVKTNEGIVGWGEAFCQGLEPPEISHTNYQSIVDSFCSDIDLALELNSYVGIATHDLQVIDYSEKALKLRNLGPGLEDNRESSPKNRVGKGPGYEFQFLLGVRGNIRRKLAKKGHLTRVYVPYGGQWYEYSMRRLRENPDIAWHVTKAILFPWNNRR